MKKIITLLLVLGMLFSLGACGGQTSDTENSTAGTEQSQTASTSTTGAPGEKTTVKILQFKVEIADQMQAMAEEYMKLHPEIDLQIESVASDNYDTLLKTRFASGEAPDIFNNEGFSEFELWKDKLEDLSDQPWVANMNDITKDGISDENGVIYGMPLYLEGYNFVYNTELFEKAGITKLPSTLDELDAVCQQLEAADIPAIIMSLSEWYNMGVFGANIAMAHQEDVDGFIDALNNETVAFEDNEVFNQWVDLVDTMKKYAYLDPLTTSFPDQISRMANGEAAITLANNGCWPSLLEINPDIKVGFMNVPINNDATYNDVLFTGVSTYWVVNKESESKQAAKDFLEWLVDSERGQDYITKEFKLISGLTNISATEEDVGPLGVAVSEAVTQGKVLGWEWPKYPDGMTEEFGIGIQKYVAGQTTKEEMLKGFTDSWKNLNS